MKQARTYKATCNYYDQLRSVTLDNTHQQLPAVLMNKKGTAILKSQIGFGGLSFETIEKLVHWQKSGKRVVQWDWKEVRQDYRAHPKRFELSIWHNDFLCGASIGKPTRGGGKLRLDYMEAHPEESPLDGLITDLVFACGLMYAQAIGAQQIRVMHPVNEKVRNYYMKRGNLLYSAEGNYCYRDI